jgi:hypothetical protein
MHQRRRSTMDRHQTPHGRLDRWHVVDFAKRRHLEHLFER